MRQNCKLKIFFLLFITFSFIVSFFLWANNKTCFTEYKLINNHKAIPELEKRTKIIFKEKIDNIIISIVSDKKYPDLAASGQCNSIPHIILSDKFLELDNGSVDAVISHEMGHFILGEKRLWSLIIANIILLIPISLLAAHLMCTSSNKCILRIIMLFLIIAFSWLYFYYHHYRNQYYENEFSADRIGMDYLTEFSDKNKAKQSFLILFSSYPGKFYEPKKHWLHQGFNETTPHPCPLYRAEKLGFKDDLINKTKIKCCD